ncbi:hypothetical protein [Emticicia oligotrophica]|uniref:hypothetical protein n=1 Tax=Emticicia oligotrophica TaxID=312279 RepID=UPI00273C7923|nr:hypothetical protein [Emticicia oligotrophica]
MRKFENILDDYNATKQKIQDSIKVTDFEIKDIARRLEVSVSTAYSKLNGGDVMIHKDFLVLADLLNIDKKPLAEYYTFLESFSKFIEENKLFKQLYFLGIIDKDNIGIKKRFKNPLVWKPEEVKAIINQLKVDLKASPLQEIFLD